MMQPIRQDETILMRFRRKNLIYRAWLWHFVSLTFLMM